jgi:hypothetical protein
VKVMVLVWALNVAVPPEGALTPVMVSGSPLASVSLARSEAAAICSAVFCWVV